jgi:hypothetical protein
MINRRKFSFARHITYLTLFLCVLLGGSVRVGIATLGNYATSLLILIIIANIQKCIKLIDQNIKLYVLFAFCFFISLLLNGEINVFDNFTYFGGRILPSIVVFIAVSFYVRSYSELRIICFLLLCIIFINACVSMLQYNENLIGQGVGYFFWQFSYDEVIYDRPETLGIIPIVGIFGHAVNNGLMTPVLFTIPIFLLHKTIFSRLVICLLFIPSIYTIYVVQQRTGFLLIVISFILVLIKMYGKRVLYFLPLIGYGIYYYILNNDIALGRYTDYSSTIREKMYFASIDWITHHIELGGPVNFGNYLNMAVGTRDPHNFFISAFVYGGIVSALIIVLLFLKLNLMSITEIYKSLTDKSVSSNYVFCFSIGLFCALINGLTHNNSIVYGYVSTWFIYALFIRSVELSKNETGNSTKQ